jgi:PKD repeat protein
MEPPTVANFNSIIQHQEVPPTFSFQDCLQVEDLTFKPDL